MGTKNITLKIDEKLEDEEKIVVYVIGSLNNTPLRGKIKIQKILFLISNVFSEYKELLEFEPHLFGPYSETLAYLIEDLVRLGLVKVEGGKYKLTEKGFKLYNHLKPERKLMEVVEDFKNFLNDLSDNEILTFIYVSYPKYIGESAKWDELKRDRIKIAISLLKKEKISFSKAVEISGMSLSEFENLLKRNRIKWKK
ncbi:UPF0175 family protein [Patescibacteria group bacterium]|nr:UPF0175 family protein [Patescibacteria group bacterium]